MKTLKTLAMTLAVVLCASSFSINANAHEIHDTTNKGYYKEFFGTSSDNPIIKKINKKCEEIIKKLKKQDKYHEKIYTKMYASITMNIRDEAYVESNILGTIKQGDTILVDMDTLNNDFALVIFHGGNAYAKSELLSDEEVEPYYPVYECHDVIMDENLQKFAYDEFSKYGIEWWMPYFIASAWQESRFNIYSEAKNGLDKGILQYRIIYWDYSNGDIFDPYAQIKVYAKTVSRRLQSGCDINTTISRHMMSDYGSYNSTYVNSVLSHIPYIIQIQ